MSQLRILNIGNTHIQVIDSDGPGVFRSVGTFATAEFDTISNDICGNGIPLAVSSVVPRLTEKMRTRDALIISGKMRLPFLSPQMDNTTVGADRIANAAALLNGPLPALSIDFGTAVTFEFVTEQGFFDGGAILPGRTLLRKSLHDYTAQLPLVPLSVNLPSIPARNTVDAIRAGTDLALIGSVKELTENFRQYAETSSLRVVACGGDRGFFLNHLKGMEDGGDFFTALGIRTLWERTQDAC